MHSVFSTILFACSSPASLNAFPGHGLPLESPRAYHPRVPGFILPPPKAPSPLRGRPPLKGARHGHHLGDMLTYVNNKLLWCSKPYLYSVSWQPGTPARVAPTDVICGSPTSCDKLRQAATSCDKLRPECSPRHYCTDRPAGSHPPFHPPGLIAASVCMTSCGGVFRVAAGADMPRGGRRARVVETLASSPRKKQA